MRIGITDFDGTLYRDHQVTDSDIAAIDAWRQAGNRFGIATGRDGSMTVHEIHKWGIPFDFLICNNGAITYDRDLAILASRELPDDVARRLLRHPAAAASVHWQLCLSGVVELYLNSDRSWFPGLGVPYREIGREEALAASGMQQVSFAYDSVDDCLRWVAMLAEELGGEVNLQQNAAFVDITAPGISKATGIADLMARMGWDTTEVYVIGDAENDLAMINRYHGFTVPGARQAVKEAARTVFPSVGAMLTAIRRGSTRKVV